MMIMKHGLIFKEYTKLSFFLSGVDFEPASFQIVPIFPFFSMEEIDKRIEEYQQRNMMNINNLHNGWYKRNKTEQDRIQYTQAKAIAYNDFQALCHYRNCKKHNKSPGMVPMPAIDYDLFLQAICKGEYEVILKQRLRKQQQEQERSEIMEGIINKIIN